MAPESVLNLWSAAGHTSSALKSFTFLILVGLIGMAGWVLMGMRHCQSATAFSAGHGRRPFSAWEGVGWMLPAALFCLVAWALGPGQASVIGKSLSTSDRATWAWAQNAESPTIHALAVALSTMGSLPALSLLVALVTLWLLHRRQWMLAASWLMACIANSLLTLALKHTFERARPPHTFEVFASGFSFPSGHASGASMVIGLFICLVQSGALRRSRWLWIMTGVCLIAAIAWSRVVLQAHYLSDVLAGLCVGGFSLAVAMLAVRWVVYRRPG